MKTILKISLIFSLIVSLNSCFVVHETGGQRKHDQGKHKGWYKKPHKKNQVVIINSEGNKGHDKHGKGHNEKGGKNKGHKGPW